MLRVLVVDDSVVFRTQISNALAKESGIEVAGTAAHGKIALQKLEQSSVDVVTLDMEMPEMNGIDVLREIKKRGFKVRVIIFSSQTQKGAEAALNALREGADDVVAKPSGDGLSFETAAEAIRSALIPKVLQFAGKPAPEAAPTVAPAPVTGPAVKLPPPPKKDLSKFSPSVLVIGSSTGGPAALENIFSTVSAPASLPILITQHMPPVFTEILAKRLGELSGIPAAEAKNGEPLLPNRIYVAPGDYHMLIEGSKQAPRLALNQAPQRNSVRPAVDYLFETASAVYGAGCFGVVLTGMGEDGLVGAREIRRVGGAILIQDKASCVVFGMPGAIFDSGDYDQISDLAVISQQVKRVIHSTASAGGRA